MTLQQLMIRLIDAQHSSMPDRTDALLDLLHVAEDLAGELSNLSHSFKEDYEDAARTSMDCMEDKKTARRYKKDAEIFCQAAHDLNKLRNKVRRKLDW